ncbi:MAG: cysteine--tRNA ligase [Candidatus Methanoperedens sp.]|nr:cysteine--tRNA ligase [Candidatus Methanoperedens sp.]CAG0993586.1 cysteinyl-tRNA synthetase [Methanosarcinales archaeon]
MLELFNSLTRKKETFEPSGDVVGIYTCGPSVYQYAHIGNFRTFVFEDVLVRYLKFKGYAVKRVMNLTDIEDKAITVAKEEGRQLSELTQYYSKIFFKDMELLNLLPADVFPRATEHVPEIIDIIKKIMENGYAYSGQDGTIYYDVSKFKDYGKLSHLKLRAGKKKIKRDEWGEDTSIISDFALWKSYEKKDRNVFWETELGKGRPGWHIECSAMGSKHLGKRFDIHVGGVDNIFPHHENVIAQNFGAFGVNPSKYWLHCRHLMVDGKKMSKSAGNFYTLHDLIDKGFEPMAIKYLLLSTNYRHRLNFTLGGLEEATEKITRICAAIKHLKIKNGADDIQKIVTITRKKFENAMDDNLNTGKVLKIMEELAEQVGRMNPDKKSSENILELFRDFDLVLGLQLFTSFLSASHAF